VAKQSTGRKDADFRVNANANPIAAAAKDKK
jgi:hypothetical protein